MTGRLVVAQDDAGYVVRYRNVTDKARVRLSTAYYGLAREVALEHNAAEWAARVRRFGPLAGRGWRR